MKTEIKKCTPKYLQLGANLIKNGQVIGYPTDTIYGLGANPFDIEAVKQIFILKDRAKFSSIILLIGKNYDINNLVENVSDMAKKVMDKFWPGPLTIIFPLNENSLKTLSPFVYGDHKTIAIRMPNNEKILTLLDFCNMPITSTSANLSGQVNPKNAIDVFNTFNGNIPLVLDGGELNNLASTLISIEGENIEVLREGKITKDEILNAIK